MAKRGTIDVVLSVMKILEDDFNVRMDNIGQEEVRYITSKIKEIVDDQKET